MASKQPKADEGFEALYKQLEEHVGKLEQGNLSLEESLALYEEGMTLARRCQELLQNAELRITRLQSEFNEGLSALREDAPGYGEPDFGDDEDEPPPE